MFCQMAFDLVAENGNFFLCPSNWRTDILGNMCLFLSGTEADI